MNSKKKPTYDELKKRLSETEGLLAKMQGSEINPLKNERDTAILSTKELAEAYLASEQNFKNSVDTCPLGIRIVTEDGDLIYANNAALEIFGYQTVEELAAVKRQELYTPESYAAHQERKRRRKLKQYVPGEYELSIRRPDGEVRNLRVFRREIMWGGEKQYMGMYEDITERKKAEDALRESEEKYHSLVEHSNDGIVFIEDGLIQYCNSKMLEMSGYTTEDIYGKSFVDFIAPEHKENVEEIYRKRIAGFEVPDRYELNLISKSGTVINTEISASLFYLRQKLVDIAVVRDISDRKKMDEALRQSEEMFAKAFRASPDAVTITTFDEGIVIDVNDAAVKNTGYSINELVGHSVYEFNLWVNPEDREKMRNLLIKNNKVDKEEYKFRTKSGEIRIWEYSAEPIVIGGRNCIISVQRDITERKQVEEALKESEREKAAILNGVSELVTFQDRELRLIWANRAAGESVGISPEKLIGRHCYEIWQNRSEPCIGCPLVESYATGQPHQAEMTSPDGRTWFVRGNPVRDEKGNVIGATEITLEITERKKAEEALKESQEMFSLAFRDSPNLMLIVSLKEGRIIEANDAYCRATGYTREEIIGHSTIELNLWHDPQQRGVIIESLKNREAISNAEVKFRAKSGEIRTFNLSMSKITLKDEPCLISIAVDITEQEKAKEALEESEARFRALFETMAQGVVYQEAGGKIISANPAAENILGLTIDQILGRTSVDPRWKSIREDGTEFPGEEHPSMVALRTGKPVDNVVMGVFNPILNEHRWILINAIPEFRDGEKTPYRAYTTFTDITEQKMAEKALQESEERYRLLYENSKDAILLTSPDGGILAANPEACRMFSRTAAEICRLGRSGVIDTTDSRLQPALERRRMTGEFSGELTGIRANGTKFPIELSSKIFYDREGKAKTSMIIRDISERKKMEEALEAEREEVKLIIDSTPILVFYKDLEGRLLRVNKTFAAALNMTEEDMLGKTVFDLYSKNIAQGMTDDDKQVYKSGVPKLNIIEQYESANGLRWVQTDKIPIFDKDNKVIGLVGFAQDITERKRAEEEIVESEERFNKAFHASPNMMAVISLEEGRFIDVNAEHTRITGYERREVIGKTTLELNLWAHPEKREEFYRTIKTEGRLKNYEILMRTKSGEIRTLLFSAEKIMLRGINCMVISALDITERKEAEERINHLNLTLHSIRNVNQLITREKDRSLLIQKVCDSLVGSQSFESAWIVLLDEKQQPIIWAGANMRKEFPALIDKIKQNNMPQCVKKALKQKQVVITEDPQKMCQGCPALAADLDIGSMIIRLEIEGKTYGVLYASILKKLIHDKEEISLFTEIAADIAFALRDIELVAVNDLREQESLRMAKMESIGMLAGGIAHDFNNLLTGIMGNIGLVKTYISPSDPTYEMLDEAEVAAVRARDLTQQLLTFAKGGKPVKRIVNTTEIIKESAEFALRGSKAKLELSFPDDLWPIEADEGQISQVINNLVINADEAMPTGGTLKISAENLTLKKSDALPVRGGNYVRIDIKDSGIGISAGHLQRIFEPYFTTKQKGSGLGLTTAYSVVKNHGGVILVESVQNEGSTFHIYLPATKKALKGAKKLIVDESGQAGGKVLIMDDEEIIRKMLKKMLSMAGYTVELSADGAEALLKYEEAKDARDPFNAVIMDLTIPGGMGGKEAIKKLLEIDPKATVIVSSGYATDPIMSDYKRYGFKAVIAKPYSVKQLRDLLSRLLTKKKR